MTTVTVARFTAIFLCWYSNNALYLSVKHDNKDKTDTGQKPVCAYARSGLAASAVLLLHRSTVIPRVAASSGGPLYSLLRFISLRLVLLAARHVFCPLLLRCTLHAQRQRTKTRYDGVGNLGLPE